MCSFPNHQNLKTKLCFFNIKMIDGPDLVLLEKISLCAVCYFSSKIICNI